MKPAAKTLAKFVVPALLAAWASPSLATPATGPKVETSPTAGLSLGAPDLRQTLEGVEIRGNVCRAPSHATAGRVLVHVQRVGADGRTSADATATLPGALGPRDRTCSPYTVHAAWTVGPGDAIRVCADRHGHEVCALRAAGD
jgi:hypothetical protein